MLTNLVKSILHNIGVVGVGLGIGYLGTMADSFLGVSAFGSPLVKAGGLLLLALGFLTRVWATVYFYAHRMRVISLEPQERLITTGPYRFSRNPLYLGGNVFIFFEASLLFDHRLRLSLPLVTFPSWMFLSGGRKSNWSELSVRNGGATRRECADGFRQIKIPLKPPVGTRHNKKKRFL